MAVGGRGVLGHPGEEIDVVQLADPGPDEHGVAGATRMAARVRVSARGGSVSAGDARLTVRGAAAVTILVAMATSYRRFDDVGGDAGAIAAAQLKRAATKPPTMTDANPAQNVFVAPQAAVA